MINPRHFEKLSRLHREASPRFYADDDVIVGAGKARVAHPVGDQDLDASGRVDASVYHKMLADAATLAAGSLVEDRFVAVSSFNYFATHMVETGKLLAAAQVVHARALSFTVNTVLTDESGRVLAVGYGIYSPGPVGLGEPEAGAPGEPEAESPEVSDLFNVYGNFLDTPFGPVSLN
jgi:hypothetical protein